MLIDRRIWRNRCRNYRNPESDHLGKRWRACVGKTFFLFYFIFFFRPIVSTTTVRIRVVRAVRRGSTGTDARIRSFKYLINNQFGRAPCSRRKQTLSLQIWLTRGTRVPLIKRDARAYLFWLAPAAVAAASWFDYPHVGHTRAPGHNSSV